MSAVQGTGPAPPRLGVRWLAGHWLAGRWLTGQRALLGTTMSLLATTVVTAVLGLAFWWAAAHLFPLSQVGYGSAAVSALTLVGTFGMAGMNTVLIGHLARSPQHANGLLMAAMYASGLISALLASGFWLVTAVILPDAAPYLHSGTDAVAFIAGSALTGATLILDQALLGTVGGSLQLWRNTAFSVAKLVALAGLAMLWHDQFGTSILIAWVAGTALSLVPVGVLLRRRGMRLSARPEWRLLRALGRASVSNTWLNNMLQAPVLAMPMLVTGMLSAADGGAFYVASTVVMVVVLLPFHFTTALYAASAADPRGLATKLRFSLRISMLAGLGCVPLVIVSAHLLLRLFGAGYAARAAVPLELLVMGYFGSVLKNHYIALCRISGRITQAGIYATVSTAARFGAAVAGAMAGGLVGLSIALLLVMTAEGIVVIPPVWAALNGRTSRPDRVQGPPRASSTEGSPNVGALSASCHDRPPGAAAIAVGLLHADPPRTRAGGPPGRADQGEQP
jgi:O-antigen/teichoic acid export membrane protein